MRRTYLYAAMITPLNKEFSEIGKLDPKPYVGFFCHRSEHLTGQGCLRASHGGNAADGLFTKPSKLTIVSRSDRVVLKYLLSGKKTMVKEISTLIEGSELPHTIGRYTIARVIEKGSMGIVYQGMDPYIKRPVAIKVTLPEDTLPENQIQNYRERFFTEAQAAGSLIHPNIVAIYDAGLEGNSCYIAMEFVEGGNLINFCSKDKLLPLDKILDITAKICEALDFAHQQGIIHRDIKPANIMITQRGIVKITDFGVAKLPRADLSESGGIIGSPAYMAPEMLRDGQVTMRSDLFSLGVTLYELLTGEQPFQAETMVEVINKVIHHEPTPIYQLNPYRARECKPSRHASHGQKPYPPFSRDHGVSVLSKNRVERIKIEIRCRKTR